ncbi:hypothetical protein HPB51_013274 [Rhipicephalus microplus]|uniref:Uncharacterized protein n=1 Tax=Rhipicephalus microplus TaxID=6941 RepID=A0A9J6EGW4_RHIMP|nr:hypothetical protein HPB51_013274 [Rhipicephalus microplus]
MSATSMVTTDHNRDMLLALLSRNKALEVNDEVDFKRHHSPWTEFHASFVYTNLFFNFEALEGVGMYTPKVRLWAGNPFKAAESLCESSIYYHPSQAHAPPEPADLRMLSRLVAGFDAPHTTQSAIEREAVVASSLRAQSRRQPTIRAEHEGARVANGEHSVHHSLLFCLSPPSPRYCPFFEQSPLTSLFAERSFSRPQQQCKQSSEHARETRVWVSSGGESALPDRLAGCSL